MSNLLLKKFNKFEKMKPIKFFAMISVVTGSCLFLTHCKKDDPSSLALQVTSFSPDYGFVGDQVTISGRNFSPVVSENQVHFNGTPAFVLDATTTSITAIVPAGATTGVIAVTVNGVTAFSHGDFEIFLHGPTLTSITPSSGVAGTSVVISGTGFSATPADNVVKFNGVSASVTSSSSNQINTIVPASATTGKITVTVNGVTLTTTTDFVIPPPTVTDFSPLYGLPGSNIVVTGSNFNSGSPSSNVVSINGVAADVTAATATQLTITVPLTGASGKIAVNVGGQAATSTGSFEVLNDIPRDGLMAFYPFKGNADDTSGNNLDGTPTNGPTLSADRFGKASQAYTLDGVDDFITMGNPALLQINNKLTVSGWFNLSATSNNMMAMITKVYFDPSAGGNPKRGYGIDQNGNTSPYFEAYAFTADGSNFAFSQTMSTDVTINTWIFIALVTDGTSWKFYQNGQLKVSGTSSNGNAMQDGTLGEFIVGKYDQGFFFNGSVDDIAVYNRGLSDDEIQKLYVQTISKY